MNKTIINGLNISYTEVNSEKNPAILFIHGNSHAENSFRDQAGSELLQDYRLLFINLPGHGKSDSAEHYSLPLFAEIIHQLTKELQLKDFMLVGHSLGGHVALHSLSHLNPSAVMIYGTPPLSKPLDISGFLPNPQARALGQEICTAEDLEDFFTALNYSGEERILALDNFKMTDPRVRTSILESVGSNNYSDECQLLKNYDGKLMVLVSEYENLVNNNYIMKMVEENKPEALKVLMKAGHVPHVEKPLEFNRILADFARETFRTETLNQGTQILEVSLNAR